VARAGEDASVRFGTSGFRGRWGIEYTEPVVRDISQAVCDFLTEEGLSGRTVVIGYDSRQHADTAAGWCAEVVSRNGFPVHLTSRDTPTPALAFYAGNVLGDVSAGVINCTASHNPIDWHGMKFSLRDGSISPPRATDFIGRRANDYRNRTLKAPDLNPAAAAPIQAIDPHDAYCGWLLESGEADCRISLDHDRMRHYFTDKLVILDEMHGTGRGYLRTVLDEIGIRYRVIHGERDPKLGGLHAANPEEPHIQGLKDAVAESRAAVGIGLDTDADRYGIVDRGGTYVAPNAILAMLTRYLGVDRKLTGCVATTNVTTHILERIAGDIPGNDAFRPAQGALPMHRRNPDYAIVRGDPSALVTENVFTVLTGLKYIIQVPQMSPDYQILDDRPADWQCRLLIGGEEASGLTTKGHVPDKDGMWAGLLVLDMIASYGRSLREIWDETQSIYGASITAPINLRAPDDRKAPFIDSFLETARREGRLAGMPVVFAGGVPGRYAEIQLQDTHGSTDTYLHVRPSGTEPLIRLYLEAASAEALSALRDEIGERGELLATQT